MLMRCPIAHECAVNVAEHLSLHRLTASARIATQVGEEAP
jgi:hypothetical protein